MKHPSIELDQLTAVVLAAFLSLIESLETKSFSSIFCSAHFYPKAKHAIFSFNVYWVLICIRFEHTFLKVQIARYIAVRHLLKADILTYIPKIGTAFSSSYNYKCHPWWRFLSLPLKSFFYKWIKHRHNKDYYLSVFPTLSLFMALKFYFSWHLCS